MILLPQFEKNKPPREERSGYTPDGRFITLYFPTPEESYNQLTGLIGEIKKMLESDTGAKTTPYYWAEFNKDGEINVVDSPPYGEPITITVNKGINY